MKGGKGGRGRTYGQAKASINPNARPGAKGAYNPGAKKGAPKKDWGAIEPDDLDARAPKPGVVPPTKGKRA